jgi:ubiquinone/menaquinone biosynthesis C-methylase UbiE
MLGSGEVTAGRRGYGRAMERRASPGRLMIEAAAFTRIEELARASDSQRRRSQMTTNRKIEAPVAQEGDRELKAATRAAWALGDYHSFAKETVWELGDVLVRACGVTTGQRALDVAAGTGNTAIRAAEAGAEVVASDLTPENFEAGRREAEAHGVELAWVEADAEALPFAEGEFDVVTSSFGAIFAPDHQAVADEMLRVCRPGGTIGMLNFTPEGLISDFFDALAPYMPPPPPGALPPPMWGSEEHVRELFGDRLESLEMTRGHYVERADGPRDYREFFKQTFGPVVGTYASLAEESERTAALDQDFLEFATRANSGAPEGPAEYQYEYLLVVARKRGA